MRRGYAHMVLDYYVDRLRAMRAERKQRLAQVRTKAQARAYQRRVRRAISAAFGPRPAKTPLNPLVTGRIERRHHTIEKLLFESRPGCLVSAHLYLPRPGQVPAPGVIGTCGHSHDGKLDPLYQAFCQRLARAGFATLIYDPFNQGERDQYARLPDRSAVANCCNAHNMMGKQLELVNQWFGAWRGWDGIRALDYLTTRPEVDSKRIGLTGNSGGGTMTTWLWALEPRFTMAAPSCFITTFLSNLENELPADCEQYPPGILGAGLELADFLIARAPDPALLLGQTYDFFDRRGLNEAYDEVRRFYQLLDTPQCTELFIGPQGHGFSRHNQEAMVDFFCRCADQPKAPRLRRTETLGSELLVTSKGNTVLAGAKPIFTFAAEQAQQLAQDRKKLNRHQLKQALRNRLNLKDRPDLPHYRTLRSTRIKNATCARYAIETEGAIRALLYKRLQHSSRSHTLDVESQVHLYLPHIATDQDLTTDPWAIGLGQDGPLYSLDTRGLGESIPDEEKDFFHPYGMDYMFHGHGILFNQSYLGRRVHDALTTVDLLVDHGARRIALYGRGQGALIALFTALLHPSIKAVTLKNGPLSYHAWTQVPLVAWPAANYIRGALTTFDLPDCLRALGKTLRLIEPWGPDMAPLKGKKLTQALAAARLSADLIQTSRRGK